MKLLTTLLLSITFLFASVNITMLKGIEKATILKNKDNLILGECKKDNKNRKLISFNWAIKRILRSKANFEILECFLSEILFEDIAILEILESESKKEQIIIYEK